MRMSEKGIKLLKGWEGFKNEAYKDQGGLLTIGVGHLLKRAELESGSILIDGEWVEWKNKKLTDFQVEKLLAQDLVDREEAITRGVKVPLNQDQFDCLCSWVFNIGVGAFFDSTLLRYLNEGKYDEVPGQLRRWNRAGGKVIEGLVQRREKEIKLWNGGYSS